MFTLLCDRDAEMNEAEVVLHQMWSQVGECTESDGHSTSIDTLPGSIRKATVIF